MFRKTAPILIILFSLAFTSVWAEATQDDYEENTTWILGHDTASVAIAPEMASSDYEENNSWVLPGLAAAVVPEPEVIEPEIIDPSAPLPVPEDDGGRSLLGGIPDLEEHTLSDIPRAAIQKGGSSSSQENLKSAAPQKKKAVIQKKPDPVFAKATVDKPLRQAPAAVKKAVKKIISVPKATRRSYYSPRLSREAVAQRFSNLRDSIAQLEQDMLIDIDNYHSQISSRAISATAIYNEEIEDVVVSEGSKLGAPQTYLMSWQGIEDDIVRYQNHQKTLRLLESLLSFFFVMLMIGGFVWAIREQERLCELYERHVRSRLSFLR